MRRAALIWAIIFFILPKSEVFGGMDKETEFCRKVVTMLHLGEEVKVYTDLSTPGFRESSSLEDVEAYVQPLRTLGEIKEMSVLGYQVYPDRRFVAVAMEVQYAKGTAEVKIVVARTEKGLKVHYLHFSSKVYEKVLAKEIEKAQDYVKRIVDVVKEGRYKEVYDRELEEGVRAQTPYNIVKPILEVLSHVDPSRLELVKYSMYRGMTEAQLIYKASIDGKEAFIQFLLGREDKGPWRLRDINIKS